MGKLQHEDQRKKIGELGREMLAQGLTTSTGGNISQRVEDDIVAISPTRIPYSEITAEDVPIMTVEGERVDGEAMPSSELPMHANVYRERTDVGGIVHTHSTYASTFAALDEPILAANYQLGYVGRKVPVAGYAPPGTEALGEFAVDALGDDYDACLLRNHGMIALGNSAEDALENALMVEHCAKVYFQAKCIGDPVILQGNELDELIETFDIYRSIET